MEDVGVLLVELGDRPDAVGAQELGLVEHPGEDPAEPLRVDQGQDTPSFDLLEHRFLGGTGDPRGPVVAEPQGRQHVQLGLLRAAVMGRYLDQDVLGRRLRILHEHVEVAVLLEDPGVEELVLHLVAAAPSVRLHQVGVGIRGLRVLVQELHVRVSWVLSLLHA
jgi:hypothetical protein